MILEVLKIVHFFSMHGFYICQEEINNIASSVISLLNGVNDGFKNGKKDIDIKNEKKDDIDIARYK